MTLNSVQSSLTSNWPRTARKKTTEKKKKRKSILLRPFDYFLTTFARVPFVMDVRGNILKTTPLLFFYHILQVSRRGQLSPTPDSRERPASILATAPDGVIKVQGILSLSHGKIKTGNPKCGDEKALKIHVWGRLISIITLLNGECNNNKISSQAENTKGVINESVSVLFEMGSQQSSIAGAKWVSHHF